MLPLLTTPGTLRYGLGRTLGADHVFGRANKVDEWDARRCIQGDYTVEDQVQTTLPECPPPIQKSSGATHSPYGAGLKGFRILATGRCLDEHPNTTCAADSHGQGRKTAASETGQQSVHRTHLPNHTHKVCNVFAWN